MFDEFDFIRNVPSVLGIKNLDSVCVKLSIGAANMLGFHNTIDIEGKKDYEIGGKISEMAEHFVALDKQCILNEKPITTLDICEYSTGIKALVVERNILKKSNRPIGIFVKIIEISGQIHLINSLRNIYKKFGYSKNTQSSHIINLEAFSCNLTKKQHSCLFFLIRGRTIKEIGKIMNISPRTVECHLELVKRKLGCKNKADLIEKCIDIGLIYAIPEEVRFPY